VGDAGMTCVRAIVPGLIQGVTESCPWVWVASPARPHVGAWPDPAPVLVHGASLVGTMTRPAAHGAPRFTPLRSRCRRLRASRPEAGASDATRFYEEGPAVNGKWAS
jgi:hypothetical protein